MLGNDASVLVEASALERTTGGGGGDWTLTNKLEELWCVESDLMKECDKHIVELRGIDGSGPRSPPNIRWPPSNSISERLENVGGGGGGNGRWVSRGGHSRRR